MRKRKYNLWQMLIATIVCCSFTVVIYSFTNKKTSENSKTQQAATQNEAMCETISHRLEGYKYVKPLLYNEKSCESENYNGLKTNIEEAIKQYQLTGNLDNATVYLKLLNTRETIKINNHLVFHPGSLIKLPMLITFLKMEEKNPGFLNTKLTYTITEEKAPIQTFNSKQLLPGKSYTIKELLKYMIVYSDNNATLILNNNADLDIFRKIYSDFGLTVPDVQDRNYQISAKDYSIFLNIIYNAGYLTISNSEYVAELLNECDFKEGIQSGLPDNTKIIHKFGEWGSFTKNKTHQLSESAIVYLDNSPYLLTIMTEGKDVKKLPSIIGDISKLIFNSLKESNKNI